MLGIWTIYWRKPAPPTSTGGGNTAGGGSLRTIRDRQIVPNSNAQRAALLFALEEEDDY